MAIFTGSPRTAGARGQTSVTDLRDLEGRGEGGLIHAFGRYELLLTVKTNWRGRIEAVLDTKELQFHDRLSNRLV